MATLQQARNQIIDRAVQTLKERLITVEEAETMMELVLNYLITEKHMDITDLEFVRLPAGCDVEIVYKN